MKVLKGIILILFFIGLLVGATGIQAALDGLALLQPGFYLRALDRAGVFAAVPDLAVAALGEQTSGLPAAEQAKIEAAIRETVTPEFVREEVTTVLGGVLGFMAGKEAELEATVDFKAFADRFLGAYAKTANPFVLSEVRRNVLTGLVPIQLGDSLLASPAFLAAVRYVRLGLRYATVLGVAWLVVAALTLLLAGSFPRGGRLIGAALLASGVLGGLAAVAVAVLRTGLLAGIQVEGLPEKAAGLVMSGASGVARGVLGVVATYAVIFVVAGMILIVLAGVAGRARFGREPAGPPAAAARLPSAPPGGMG